MALLQHLTCRSKFSLLLSCRIDFETNRCCDGASSLRADGLAKISKQQRRNLEAARSPDLDGVALVLVEASTPGTSELNAGEKQVTLSEGLRTLDPKLSMFEARTTRSMSAATLPATLSYMSMVTMTIVSLLQLRPRWWKHEPMKWTRATGLSSAGVLQFVVMECLMDVVCFRLVKTKLHAIVHVSMQVAPVLEKLDQYDSLRPSDPSFLCSCKRTVAWAFQVSQFEIVSHSMDQRYYQEKFGYISSY